MPPEHREVAGSCGQTLTAPAEAVALHCTVLVALLRGQRQYPQQVFRIWGVLSLEQKYGIGRLDAACVRALKQSTVCWKCVQTIPKNRLDLQ